MENLNLIAGLRATAEITVSKKDTAVEMSSGSLDVYATPAMVALMEKAALSVVDPYIPAGYSTVGTMINVNHISATPLEMKVKATAELISVEGKKLTFKVEAYDEKSKIGEGMHERFIIEVERFRNKVYSK